MQVALKKNREVKHVILRAVCDLLGEIHMELRKINDNLDRIIKRISVFHNEKNVGLAARPYGWLTPSERLKAKALRKKDPETFDYVTECLKLFLTKDGDD